MENFEYKLNQDESGELSLSLHGALNSSNLVHFVHDMERDIEQHHPGNMALDLSHLDSIDDFGVSALVCFKKNIVEKGGNFKLTGIQPEIQHTLKILNFDKLTAPLPEAPRPLDLFTKVGTSAVDFSQKTAFALSFLGDTFFSFMRVMIRPRKLRLEDTVDNMRRVGVDALPIVGLISFLLGLIMAFMSSVQLKQFGANIYVASLVGLSMTRELGPIMTAIIVSGRSSSAFAAEIGSMKISDEIDALFTMGIDPHQFLVLPRVIASCLMVPLLTLFSDVFAIAGGLVVGITMLGLTVDGYINQTIRTLQLFDVFWGFFKSGVFALFLSWIGCLRGFQVKEGAADVGRATTSAVVSSIFMIIVIDSTLVVILRYW